MIAVWEVKFFMKVREMPWFERPGARLKRKGAESLSDAELLAIVLWRGDQTENAIDLSRRVLASCNLPKLSTLSLAELQDLVHDEVKALKLVAMFEVLRRTEQVRQKGFSAKITCAEDVYHHFAARLADKKKEYFYALLLDTKNRIIAEELISVGLLDASLIHPREVFASAIKNHAKAIILVHNHPSGECTPSKQDEEVTQMLKNAGETLGIAVLDHVIVGTEGFATL